jgi:hypothetical protein
MSNGKTYIKERIKGRLSIPVTDIKTEKDIPRIAKKHGVDIQDIEYQLSLGRDIEHEHTGNMDAATDIALDHLDELPDYYTRLKKMEKNAKSDMTEAKTQPDSVKKAKQQVKTNIKNKVEKKPTKQKQVKEKPSNEDEKPKKYSATDTKDTIKRKYLGTMKGRTQTGKKAHQITIDPVIDTQNSGYYK